MIRKGANGISLFIVNFGIIKRERPFEDSLKTVLKKPIILPIIITTIAKMAPFQNEIKITERP